MLGSFGDNDLSPECLDGAQRFLKPDGISIPISYVYCQLNHSSPSEICHRGLHCIYSSVSFQVYKFHTANYSFKTLQ